MVKNVIFDFDGTIANSFEVMLGVFNDLAGKYNYDPITHEQLESVKTIGSRKFLGSLNLNHLQHIRLMSDVMNELSKHIGEMHLFSGMRDSLVSIKNAGYFLGILTSNKVENVDTFLTHNDLAIFNFVQQEVALFGKDVGLKRVMSKYGMDLSQTIYIGDEVRDIEGAHGANIRSIAVTWGYNSKELLGKAGADTILDTPDDLLNCIKEL
jgi:phosphoglycolate phosphatase-like HAD superfamily hydrolase